MVVIGLHPTTSFNLFGWGYLVEARNIFCGLVDWEYLKEYVDTQLSKSAIIPDILVHNYPGSCNSNGNAFIAAMFDVKTVRVDKLGSIWA